MRPQQPSNREDKQVMGFSRLRFDISHEVWCGVLYCTVLYCTVCTVLYYTTLCCTALHCAVLYCTVLCCAVLYCVVLCCTVLYMLYSTLLYSAVQCYVLWHAVSNLSSYYNRDHDYHDDVAIETARCSTVL